MPGAAVSSCTHASLLDGAGDRVDHGFHNGAEGAEGGAEGAEGGGEGAEGGGAEGSEGGGAD